MEDDRLIKIETTLMHQDQQILELEEAVETQRREIESLRKYLERLLLRVDEVAAGAGEDGKGLSVSEQALRDKPPHY